MLLESRSLESGLACRLEEERDGLESEIGALLAVPMVGIHLGSAPERSPRWATGFWLCLEEGIHREECCLSNLATQSWNSAIRLSD